MGIKTLDKKTVDGFLRSMAIEELISDLTRTNLQRPKRAEEWINNNYDYFLKIGVDFFDANRIDSNKLLLENNSRFIKKDKINFHLDLLPIIDNKLPRYMQHHILYEVRLNDDISMITDGGYILNHLIGFTHTKFNHNPDDLMQLLTELADKFNLVCDLEQANFNVLKFVHHKDIVNEHEIIYQNYFEFVKQANLTLNQDKYSYSHILHHDAKEVDYLGFKENYDK